MEKLTLFTVLVCMALVAAAFALTFTVDVRIVQLLAAAVGGVTIFVAMIAVPDTVIGTGQPDTGEESLQRYLRERQRHTQMSLLWLAFVATVGASAAWGFLAAEASGDPDTGIILGIITFVGGAIGAAANPSALWPPELRGK